MLQPALPASACPLLTTTSIASLSPPLAITDSALSAAHLQGPSLLQIVHNLASLCVHPQPAYLAPLPAVERSDPAHWRAVLSSMLLSEEQEAQLIILLQSHLQQARRPGVGDTGHRAWRNDSAAAPLAASPPLGRG